MAFQTVTTIYNKVGGQKARTAYSFLEGGNPVTNTTAQGYLDSNADFISLVEPKLTAENQLEATSAVESPDGTFSFSLFPKKNVPAPTLQELKDILSM